MRPAAIWVFLIAVSAPAAALAQSGQQSDQAIQFIIDTGVKMAAALAAFSFVIAYGLRDIGLAREKNAPAVCLRMLAAIAVTVLAFWLSGYALAHSVEETGLLGEFGAWRLEDADPLASSHAAGIDWLFQAGLAAMAASIIAASVSERVRLWAFLLFTGFLTGLIYPIGIGWMWNGGYFDSVWRFYDGGGASVHVIAGAAALAGAIVVGPRPERFKTQSPWIAATSLLPLSVVAAGIAWIALHWVYIGYAGAFSGVDQANRVGIAFANMAIATSAAVLAALTITQFVYNRPGLVTTMCAIVAGPITLLGDPVSPSFWQAALIGAVGGVIVTVAPPFLTRFKIDDAGFVVPTHLLCGLWSLLIVAWVNSDVSVIDQAIGVIGLTSFTFLMSMLIWAALRYSPFGVRQRPPARRTLVEPHENAA